MIDTLMAANDALAKQVELLSKRVEELEEREKCNSTNT